LPSPSRPCPQRSGIGTPKQPRARLEEIGFELPIEDFLVKFRPTEEDLAAAEEWGKQIAEAVKAR
jgi:flavorubredoxin